MATINLSEPIFYKAGESGASKIVGYESSSRRVARYMFTAPSTGAKGVSLKLYTAGRYSGSHIPIRYYIGTSATSHANAGAESEYTGELTLSTSDYITFTGSASILLLPNTTYYLWIFPGEDTWGTYQWENANNASNIETSGSTTYVLSISQGTGSKITVKRNGTALSNGATITYGDVLTITFAAATGYNLGTHTVNGATFASGGTHTVTGAVAVAATARLKTFKLTISAGTGAIVSVKRNGTALSNGATLSYGDELTITFAAGTGYKLTSTSHTSGETYTVTGAVTVSATAAVLSYLLSISQGEGTVISVTRTSSPKQGAAVGALSHGAAVYYSDVLEITITAKGGYKLSSATVNGSAFTSGNSHTVTGAVNVAAVAVLYAYLIGSGTSQKEYVAQIKSGGTVKTYVGFIKRGGQWYPCGQ